MEHCLRVLKSGLLAACLMASTARGGILPDHLVDPDDGMLDMSAYLASARGFLPVPILITEPAVGFGLGMAVAYFHAPQELDSDDHPHVGPPSITVGLGGLTTNQTWFSGLAHLGVWFDDHVRYTGVGAYANVNLDWYGLDLGIGDREENPLRFNAESWVLFQQLRYRILESNWWAGANFLYTNSEIEFELPPVFPPEFPSLKFGVDQGAAGVLVEYDGRNTTFTATRGTRGLAEVDFYREGLGGEFSYEAYHAYVHQFVALGDYSSIGLRVDGQTVDGKAPFYAYPFVQLRGIPVMRYQGKTVLVGEAELLWGFTPRWTLVGFGGVGHTDAAIGDRSETLPTYGGGFRYRLAKLLGLQGGLDIARGPEDTAVYITVGSAWY
jgi:hypothetical protein